jgi:hypothetical protein
MGKQERLHARRSFRVGYLRLLKRHEIAHDEKYLFEPLDCSIEGGSGHLYEVWLAS